MIIVTKQNEKMSKERERERGREREREREREEKKAVFMKSAPFFIVCFFRFLTL